ncbi:GNAT acetyltransferase 2, partial [Helicosporidium sp. ATCC 50920]
ARVGAGVGATDGSAEEAGVSEPPAAQLKDLQASLADTQPAGPLVSRCATLDQAKAVVTFLDAASERTLRSTVALTAARGRGKSAALGLAIAGALGLGYSNIFVTAPSPENLRTLFAFVLKGLDRLGFQEHQDYDLVESTNPAFGKAIVRVNVFRSHRQTVQYIQPQHAAALAQAELLVIDEAAAIPLPVVRSLLGPYLVFLCSTVNGYEGTGRSLSLKLIHELRAQGAKLGKGAFEAANASAAPGSSSGSGRTFREVVLREPIRYAPGDGVERWLNQLLLLDAGEALPPPPARLPHPSECQLFHVERDTLFSHHRASEAFLSRVWALYVASHYKNSPNDLLLLSDAPAHRLFVLLGPVQSAGKDAQGLPDVLCVLQVALEGAVSAQSAQAALASGSLPQGDLIPWTLSQQFQDPEFAALSGARVVRIATHPDLVRAGYGARALELLSEYFAGRMEPDLFDLAEDGANNKGANNKGANSKGANNKGAAAGDDCLHSEKLAPRSGLPPLLVPLADRRAERLHWLGVSCGLTGPLLAFWKRTGMQPLYLRQTAADATGEHTVIMLKSLWEGEAENGTSEAGAAGSQASPASWLAPFFEDFSGRLRALLAGPFKPLPTTQALSLLSPRLAFSDAECAAHASRGRLCTRADGASLSAHDLARLEAYTSGVTDHHLVADLVPSLAHAFFSGTLPATLSHAQAVILLHVGLQARPLEELSTSLNLPAAQVLALYSKALHRLHRQLRAAQKQALERSLPDAAKRALPRLELMRRRGDHRDAAG